MFDLFAYSRFTDRARKVMQLANQEAQRFNHEYVGTEHVLLGLVKEGAGVAANVLKNCEVDLKTIRAAVEKIVQRGPEMVTLGKLPQTPRVKEALEFAGEEARGLNHNYIGTEHLLLGLIRVEQGVAAQVLQNLGLTFSGLREELMRLLENQPSDSIYWTPRTSRAFKLGQHFAACLRKFKSWLGMRSPTPPQPAQPQVVLEPIELSRRIREIVDALDDLIDVCNGMKEKAVATTDYDWAALLRERVEKPQEMKAWFIQHRHKEAEPHQRPEAS